VGLTVLVDILAIGPLTGAAMNPSRAFGPTIVGAMAEGGGKLWATHWIYWVGPLVGGALAALLYNGLFMPKGDAAKA